MQSLKTCLAAAFCLMVAQHAWADTMRCGDKLIMTGESMAAVKALCGAPASVQQGVRLDATTTRIGEGAVGQSHTVGTEVPVETWTYNRGPDKLMMTIRFVDGKVVTITTLHDYGH